MKTFSDSLALVISYLFHPLFMPTNGLLVIYFFGSLPGFNKYSTDLDKSLVFFTITIVFVATSLLPVIIAVILKKTGLITSLSMPIKEERSIPFILTSFCYFGAYYYLRYYLDLPINRLIYYFIFFGVFATVLGFFITLSWKISIHMIGIGGLVGILTLLSKNGDQDLFLPLMASVITAGLIGFGRLQLRAHNIKQIIAGFVIGFGSEVIGLFVL